MPNPYHHPADVLRFAAEQRRPYALIVVTKVTGGTMRSPGALMCVSQMGETAGYISNGCVDADIIFQARQVIESGETINLCYGEGSPFMDIQLPCGGRIDLVVVPNPPQSTIIEAADNLANRQSVDLSFGGHTLHYHPKLRIRIAGRGEAVRALVRQSIKTGLDVILQSPEENIAKGLSIDMTEHLTDPARLMPADDDRWTAVVLMFHDHDWEPEILMQALKGSAFYIGAMGSPKTQLQRCDTLRARGVQQEDVDRIHGPIGLISSMRDANLLALSTLAEIVSIAQEKNRL